MLKKISVLVAAGAFVFSLSACGKQEQAKQPEAPAAKPAGPALALPQKGQEATVTVPADVKSKWKAIKVTVEDKKKKSKKEYEIKVGDSMDIPGTKLSVKAVEFVPSFVMQGLNITSSSAEPTNPAAKVVITDGGKEVFKGWLFQKFPTTHAFTHPDYAVTLTGWVQS
jgi:hypothetical protein